MRGVQVADDGRCTEVNVSVKKNELKLGNKLLNTHFCDESLDVRIVSPVMIETPFDEASMFQLPPPLNTYVLPHPIIMVRAVRGNMSVCDIEKLITQLHRVIAKKTNADAVYDVPPVEEEEEEGEEDEDEDEDEGEESDVCSEDEDWEEEDIVVPAPK